MRLLLDLTDISNSDISYKVSTYPDGQQSITINSFDITQKVQLSSRMNSFRDVELIICANQTLKEMGAEKIELYVPYFIGARSDRKFGEGQTNYLKNVICPIINSQGFSKVIVLDPHSDVLEACLNNFHKINNVRLVGYAISNITHNTESKIGIVSPDAGALKKIFDIAKVFDIENVTTASKVRDMVTGNIVRTELPTMDLRGIEHLIVIDDICDGGRTFIELAKAIKEITDIPLHLIVTHGIFSAGFEELEKYFESIYTTDSIREDVKELGATKVNQLFIF
jgi:ribose-phosphate pyrophosphokinase